MKYQSLIEARGAVPFPPFMAERVYMREFYKKDGLPSDLSRWQPTVDAMLDGVDTDGPIYLMVDAAPVTAGKSHRRRGLHIDGYWNPGSRNHGEHRGISAHGSSSGWGSAPVGHGAFRRHGSITPTERRHVGQSPFHSAGSDSWEQSTFEAPEAIILASSLSAAVGYTGEFEGPIRDGGDCAHIDLSGLTKLNMEANRVYVGNVTALHESLPVHQDGVRQLVRLNTAGWSI